MGLLLETNMHYRNYIMSDFSTMFQTLCRPLYHLGSGNKLIGNIRENIGKYWEKWQTWKNIKISNFLITWSNPSLEPFYGKMSQWITPLFSIPCFPSSNSKKFQKSPDLSVIFEFLTISLYIQNLKKLWVFPAIILLGKLIYHNVGDNFAIFATLLHS